MRDIIGAGILATMLVLVVGTLLLARWVTVKNHREQFKATGHEAFPLPPQRVMEREEWHAAPTQPVAVLPSTVLDAETGEMIRLDVDGLPMSEADVAARTAPTTLTVDPEQLARVLQLEETGEYAMNALTWVECDAAELFMRNPLTTPLLPPQPLVEQAGNPALADAFWSLVNAGQLTTDWQDEDSDFHFWDQETALAGALVS